MTIDNYYQNPKIKKIDIHFEMIFNLFEIYNFVNKKKKKLKREIQSDSINCKVVVFYL